MDPLSVFIDESGIHAQIGHATNAIVYVTIDNVEEVEGQIKRVLQELHLESFHWAEHGWTVKKKFLNKISKLNFQCKVGVFKNPVEVDEITEKHFILITETNIEKVWLDGKQPKWYERKLKKVLRDKGISVKKLKTVRNEKSQPCIQLADALAGLVRYPMIIQTLKMQKNILRV